MLADPVAQHTHQVVWRDGDLEAVPKVYCTTTVNFGDKPAGYIAIAAIKETADLFGGDGEAAYFLKNCTYVDDCVAGSNSKPELEKISRELEEIVAKGGFKFKETHMTCDPIKDGEPIKVLGLIWNTEKDEFKVDVKVNFSGKRGGGFIPLLMLIWTSTLPTRISSKQSPSRWFGALHSRNTIHLGFWLPTLLNLRQ